MLRVVTRKRDPIETLALADQVLQMGSVFFDYGINDGKGGTFSVGNEQATPTQKQLEMLSLGVLARLVFMDQMIETNLDYVVMTPAFGDKMMNCGGSDKAVLVIRAKKNGDPVLDVCSEIPANIPFPTQLNSEEFINVQNISAKSCGNCRQQCEYPFKFNRDLGNNSQLPLSEITTIKQFAKAVGVKLGKNPTTLPTSRRRMDQWIEISCKISSIFAQGWSKIVSAWNTGGGLQPSLV